MRTETVGEAGYILPALAPQSDSFIAEEVRLLESMGLKLRLYSLAPADDGAAPGADVSDPLSGLPRVEMHVRLAAQRPRQYLGTLLTALALSWRYRRVRGSAPYTVLLREFLRAAAIASQVLKDGRVRHLHACCGDGVATVAWFAGRLTDLPFSFSAHARDIHRADLNPGDLLRRKMRAARFVVTCSAGNRTHLASVCPEQEAVHTLHHGLDTDYFCPRLPAPTGLPLILAVGAFTEQKGFDYLVAACAQLKAAGVQAHCTLVGPPGPHSAQIAALIERLGVAEVVSMHGGVTQQLLRELYRRATLFVLPCVQLEDADRDSIPHVLVQAMASGVPVVSTALPGIRELIRHGVAGVLVPERDSRALARAMRALLHSPMLRQKLSEAARRTICAQFDSRPSAAALHRLFAQSIGAHEDTCAALPDASGVEAVPLKQI